MAAGSMHEGKDHDRLVLLLVVHALESAPISPEPQVAAGSHVA